MEKPKCPKCGSSAQLYDMNITASYFQCDVCNLIWAVPRYQNKEKLIK